MYVFKFGEEGVKASPSFESPENAQYY